MLGSAGGSSFLPNSLVLLKTLKTFGTLDQFGSQAPKGDIALGILPKRPGDATLLQGGLVWFGLGQWMTLLLPTSHNADGVITEGGQ